MYVRRVLSGFKEDDSHIVCPECDGQGWYAEGSYGNPPEQVWCPVCDSKGVIDWITKMKLGIK